MGPLFHGSPFPWVLLSMGPLFHGSYFPWDPLSMGPTFSVPASSPKRHSRPRTESGYKYFVNGTAKGNLTLLTM
jgi:hypothetical protein